MHLDDVGVAVPVTPDPFEQGFAGDHAGWVLDQHRQQVELGAGEVKGRCVEGRDPRLGIQAQRTHLEPGLLLVVATALLAAKQGADTGQHDLGRERLGDVVVAAGREAHELVDLVCPGGQEDDRSRGHRAQLPAHLEPVHRAEADVQEDQIGLVGVVGLDAGRPGVGLDDPVTRVLEGEGQQVADLRCVVDDQDGLAHVGTPVPVARRASNVVVRACSMSATLEAGSDTTAESPAMRV